MFISSWEQVIGRPCSSVATMPPIQYVNGLTRYMNFQKPGSASAVCRTPEKIIDMTVRIMTTEDAVWASGMTTIVISAKAEA